MRFISGVSARSWQRPCLSRARHRCAGRGVIWLTVCRHVVPRLRSACGRVFWDKVCHTVRLRPGCDATELIVTPSWDPQTPSLSCAGLNDRWIQPTGVGPAGSPGVRLCSSAGHYRALSAIDNLRSLYSLGILTGVKVLVNYTRWFFWD